MIQSTPSGRVIMVSLTPIRKDGTMAYHLLWWDSITSSILEQVYSAKPAYHIRWHKIKGTDQWLVSPKESLKDLLSVARVTLATGHRNELCLVAEQDYDKATPRQQHAITAARELIHHLPPDPA